MNLLHSGFQVKHHQENFLKQTKYVVMNFEQKNYDLWKYRTKDILHQFYAS